MHKHNCGCGNQNCGCNGQPNIIGCPTKVDLLCTNYTGNELQVLDIEQGSTGNEVVEQIDEYLANLPATSGSETFIESIGGKVDIYKGIEGSFHQIKSIQGQLGVIVEDNQGSTDCDSSGQYVNVRIDQAWLTEFLNKWIKTYNLCPLIANCAETPLQAPIANNLTFNLPNQIGKIFNQADFNFTDPEGGTFVAFRLIGVTSNFRISNQPYASNTDVTALQLVQNAFRFVAPAINTQATTTVQYQTKSSTGLWSNLANLTIINAEKIIPVFDTPPIVELIRGVTNNKTATITYSNGHNQVRAAGVTIYTVGTSGQPGYIKVSFANNTTLSPSGGTFNANIVSIPHDSLVGNPSSISYTIDDGGGLINFEYSSIPTVDANITKSTAYLQPVAFTVTDFENNSSDLDGDIVEARILPQTTAGAVSSLNGYLYNGLPYDGSWVPITSTNLFSYQPENITAGYQKRNKWQVRDANGNTSS